ncbi:conserved hypothetical protein [Vibrio chagasii]|nr:conserved hypothetical protein [Vibrio chagasii]
MNSIFVSFYAEDAQTILNMQAPDIEGADALFEACEAVIDSENVSSGDSLQFNLTVSKELTKWCKSMIADESDDTGILEYIVMQVNNKASRTVH